MSNDVFMTNIDNVRVSSRVKEPYSLWKKILRHRKEAVRVSPGESTYIPTTLSIKWVPDAIALRVIIRGRQMPIEDGESLRTREKMLCYFALQMIADCWPASNANVAKDYISNPKPNGYQSLHYTASLAINGEDWPFEVQVCSILNIHSLNTYLLHYFSSFEHILSKYILNVLDSKRRNASDCRVW